MKCKTSSVVSEVDIKFKKKAGMDPEHLFSVFSLLDDLYFKMSQDKTDSILVEYVTVPSLSLKNLVWTIWAFHPSFAFHAFFVSLFELKNQNCTNKLNLSGCWAFDKVGILASHCTIP